MLVQDVEASHTQLERRSYSKPKTLDCMVPARDHYVGPFVMLECIGNTMHRLDLSLRAAVMSWWKLIEAYQRV